MVRIREPEVPISRLTIVEEPRQGAHRFFVSVSDGD
jgi:hypothetical protein